MFIQLPVLCLSAIAGITIMHVVYRRTLSRQPVIWDAKTKHLGIHFVYPDVRAGCDKMFTFNINTGWQGIHFERVFLDNFLKPLIMNILMVHPGAHPAQDVYPLHLFSN